MSEVYEVLKKYLSERKFYHCIKEEQQLQYLFSRNDLCFPSCEILKQDGNCPGDCEFKGKAVYK